MKNHPRWDAGRAQPSTHQLLQFDHGRGSLARDHEGHDLLAPFRLRNANDGHIRNRRASIGYIIDPTRHRQGIATEAVSALLEHCFGDLRLHRLQAFINPDNTASRALIEKLGFRQEGLLRDNLRVNDLWRTDLLYARLATDRAPGP